MKLIVLLLCISLSMLRADEQEEALRGVVLQKINQFISFDQTANEFIICVYKNQILADTLKDLYKSRKYNNLPISIKHISSLSDVKSCNVLFMDNGNKADIQILNQQAKRNFISVTNSEEKLDDGYSIAIFIKNGKVNFSINQPVINNAGLRVDYRLLKVASKVISKAEE